MVVPRALAASALIAAAALTGAAQQAPVSLRIVSPTSDAYLSGPVRLAARIEPPAATRLVKRVVFFADGPQVCTIVTPPFDCEWDAGDRVEEHQIRAVALMSDGSRLVATVRTPGARYVETSHVDIVQVTAVVTDRDGRFVHGLTQKDFRLYEDDRQQPVTHFASQNIPLELVTAIDISSSMTDALTGVKQAAKQFLAGLEAGDQVTVLGFNENIFTLARRATDPEVRARAVDRLAPWGGTALYDAIVRAVDVLGRQTGRRAIVLFTDGDDQSSHATLNAAIARTEGSDATIYPIGQGRAVSTSQFQQLLKRLAATSGGRAFFTEDPAALTTAFNDILADLRGQYLIAFAPSSTARDGSWHRIRVEVTGNHLVRARQGYRLERRS
jgi:VWFA-related protein